MTVKIGINGMGRIGRMIVRSIIENKNKNIENLEKITQIFFSTKRKMINKPFSKIFKNYRDIAKLLKIDLNKRPADLSSNDFFRITEKYEKKIN